MEGERVRLDELRKRTKGPIPDHWWQRAQSFVVIIGIVFTAVQVRLALREANRKSLLTASEHLHEGYLSGATELEAVGDEGLQVLVDSVDPDGTLTQKAWPATTRAALAVLSRHRLPKNQTAKLVKDMDLNLTRLGKELNDYPKDSSDARKATVKSLYCVQVDLQQAARQKPEHWGDATPTDAKARVVSNLGDEPHC